MSVNSKMTAIANAIRSLLGTSGTYTLDTMASAISGITKKSAQTYTPTTSNQTIASGQYLSGAQTISGDANLVAGNIKQGVSIFGVVGSHSGGITPTGTVSITSNGIHDVTNYASASVSVVNDYVRRWVVTVDSDVTSYYTLIDSDSWVAQHRNETSFSIAMYLTSTLSTPSVQAFVCGINRNIKSPDYGVGLVMNTSGGVTRSTMTTSVSSENGATCIYTNTKGDIKYGAKSNFILPAGTYVIVAMRN